MPAELAVVMPVFNEEAALDLTVGEWMAEIGKFTGEFVLILVDDGSSDSSPSVIADLRQRHPKIVSLRQANQGHGQACIAGYKHALELRTNWVFQIDSDGQCPPEYFHQFWRLRFSTEAVHGRRVKRGDGLVRQFGSVLLPAIAQLATRVRLPDPNVPYRLYTSACLQRLLPLVPDGVYLKNMALAILAAAGGRRTAQVEIDFRNRRGGRPSCSNVKLLARALQAYFQLRKLRHQLPVPQPGSQSR